MTTVPEFRPRGWSAPSSRFSPPKGKTARVSVFRSVRGSSGPWGGACGCRTSIRGGGGWGGRAQGRARFAVELPVVKEAAAGETPGDVSATDRQRHVLVVEDDPAVRRGMV